MKSTDVKIAKRSGRMAMAGAAVLLAAAFVATSVVPASANGSFNVKLSAWGCTEGDYYGTSYSSIGGGSAYAHGVTSYQYPICAPSASSIPGVRAYAGGASTGWQYSPGSRVEARVQKSDPNATAWGNHTVGGANSRNS